MNKVLEAINGIRDFDLVIKNIQYVNVITKEVYNSEIGIIDGVIGHVNQDNEAPLKGVREIDG